MTNTYLLAFRGTVTAIEPSDIQDCLKVTCKMDEETSFSMRVLSEHVEKFGLVVGAKAFSQTKIEIK